MPMYVDPAQEPPTGSISPAANVLMWPMLALMIMAGILLIIPAYLLAVCAAIWAAIDDRLDR